MVKYIIVIGLILFGCEINSEQVIKPEKFSYDTIKFSTVSKKLINDYASLSKDHKKISDIIEYWFDNRIKTDGFEGSLLVNIKEIKIKRQKKKDYYEFSIFLSIEFLENTSLNNNKTFIVNSREFGDIRGSFSINDQENLDINLMHQSLENISIKLKEIN